MIKFGLFLIVIGVLFSCLVSVFIVVCVVLFVCRLWMIFINVIIGIGLKKCMLMKWFVFCSMVVSLVIEIDEVFDVMIVCGVVVVLSCLRIFIFRLKFLVVVLMMRLVCLRLLYDVEL